MQDEPERGVCFSHKMSLKGRGVGMLGIDRPRAKRQQVEPATDPAVSPLQRRDSMQRQRAGRDLRLGGAHAPPARLQPPEPRRQRAAAAVSGQDDRTEPGANHAADPAIPAGRRTPTRPLPAASLCPQVHARRRRTASGGGRGPRNPQRPGPRARSSSGHTSSTSSANTSGWRGSRWPRSIRLRRRSAYRQRPAAFHQDPAHGGVDRRAAPARPARTARLSCEWIRCIKGIAMASRASTPSMPWMKSPSGKWSAPQPRSVKPGWSRCCKP